MKDVDQRIVAAHVIFGDDDVLVKLMIDAETSVPTMAMYEAMKIPVQEKFHASSPKEKNASMRLKEFNVKDVTETFTFGVKRASTTKVDFVCGCIKSLQMNLQLSSMSHFYTLLRFPELVSNSLIHLANVGTGNLIHCDPNSPTFTLYHPDFSFEEMAMFYETIMDGTLEKLLANGPIRGFFLDGWKTNTKCLGNVTYLFFDQHLTRSAAERLYRFFEGRLGFFSNIHDDEKIVSSLTLSHRRHYFLRHNQDQKKAVSPFVNVCDLVPLGDGNNFKACQQIMKGYFKRKKTIRAMTVDGLFPFVVPTHRLTVNIKTAQLEVSFILMMQRIFFDVEQKYITSDLLDAIHSLYFVMENDTHTTIGIGLKGTKHQSVLESIRLAVNKIFEDAVLIEDRVCFSSNFQVPASSSSLPTATSAGKQMDFLAFKNPKASTQVAVFAQSKPDQIPMLLSSHALESFGSKPVNCLEVPGNIRDGKMTSTLWLLDSSFVHLVEVPEEGSHFNVMASLEKNRAESFSCILKAMGQVTGKNDADGGSFNFVRILFKGDAYDPIIIQLCKLTKIPKQLGWAEQAGRFTFGLEEFPFSLTRYARFSTFEEFSCVAPWYSGNIRVTDLTKMLENDAKNKISINFHQHGHPALALSLMDDLIQSHPEFMGSLLTASYGESNHFGFLNALLDSDFDLTALLKFIEDSGEGHVCGITLPPTVDVRNHGLINKVVHIDSRHPYDVNGVPLTNDVKIEWAKGKTTIARKTSPNCKFHSEKQPSASVRMPLPRTKVIARLDRIMEAILSKKSIMNIPPWVFALHSIVILPPAAGKRGQRSNPWTCEVHFMKYVVNVIGCDVIWNSLKPLVEEEEAAPEPAPKMPEPIKLDPLDLTMVTLNGAQIILHELLSALTELMTISFNTVTEAKFSQRIEKSIKKSSLPKIVALIKQLLAQKLEEHVSSLTVIPDGTDLKVTLHLCLTLGHSDYITIIRSLSTLVHETFRV